MNREFLKTIRYWNLISILIIYFKKGSLKVYTCFFNWKRLIFDTWIFSITIQMNTILSRDLTFIENPQMEKSAS